MKDIIRCDDFLVFSVRNSVKYFERGRGRKPGRLRESDGIPRSSTAPRHTMGKKGTCDILPEIAEPFSMISNGFLRTQYVRKSEPCLHFCFPFRFLLRLRLSSSTFIIVQPGLNWLSQTQATLPYFYNYRCGKQSTGSHILKIGDFFRGHQVCLEGRYASLNLPK